ncbi:GHKL domain-containing protein [Clostridium sp. CT7]|nr:GHKL domain-containing protein [Clostridium sp. CT7]
MYFAQLLVKFTLIPAFLPAVLCCISVCLFYRNIINMKELGKFFFISYIINIVLLTGSYLIILPILTAISIVKLRDDKDKNKIKILMAIYSTCVISILTNIFVLLVSHEKVEEYNVNLSKYQIMSCIISLIIIFLVWGITRVIGKKMKVKQNKSLEKVRLRMIVSISIPIAIVIFLIFFLTYRSKLQDFAMSNFVPQMLPLISIILIISIIYNYDKTVESSVELKREVEEKKQIEEYSHVIEGMYSDTRRFKHDYMNMLSPLKGYIDSNDMDGLKEFFYGNVIDMDKDIQWNNTNIDKLKYINITGLKAILSTKLIKAVSMNVDIKVEILEDINGVSMNIMDLCRIIGILFDNAIEASTECEYPKLSICIVNKDGYVLIAIQNNFFGEKPAIYKIYKEGFSTKGKGRGLGLYTVKHIIDTKYDNAFLNTSIENNMFIQELWIKNK